jgi:hypothetical protein
MGGVGTTRTRLPFRMAKWSLLEGSVGPVGVARIDYTGEGGTERLLLAGSPVAGTFGSKCSLGVYGGSPVFGGGAYVNVTTNASCQGK